MRGRCTRGAAGRWGMERSIMIRTRTAVLAVPVGDGSGSGSGNEQQPAELYAWGHLGAHTALSPVLISHVLQHPFMNNAAHIEAIAVGDGVVGIVGVEDTQQRRCLIFGTTPTTDPATGIKPPDYPETRPNPRLAEVWDAPPVADVLLDAVPVRKIACGADFGVALHEGGTLALFDIGREGAESREVLTDVADVALSPTSLLVLKRDGSIVAWGAAAAAAETSPPPESKPQMKTKWYWPFGSGSTSTGSDAGSGLHPRITAVRITGSPPRVVARMTGEPQATRVEAGWDHFAVW
ncbi:uncharacterized protein EV422DRAFT_268813 [Fimicolochytrium jonesii]|uniref:uncharacterized protein n=1 Tax=Fimicolochytrium jonesii TaxID=1396493 RepID=UPI0022FF0A3D|nr:uncharacterized protein EV422DRAFT_268813 [Fimicolochytrium jonesii]KAI8816999.1 hypothetical protein EV422DRAFT_268813 [Fimicolochytrium jonesii]